MALQLIVSEADASALGLGNITFPVPAGLTDLEFFGGTLIDSVTNQVTGGAPLIAVGPPTIDSDDFLADPVNTKYLQLPTFDLAAVSYCFVTKGAYKNDGNVSWGEFLMKFFGHTSNDNNLRCFTGGQQIVAPFANTDPTQWAFYACAVNGAGLAMYQGYAGSLVATSVTAANTRVNDAGPNFIGSSATPGFGAGTRTSNPSMVARYNGTLLNQAQVQAIYTWLQQVYSNRGLTLV